MMECFYRVIAGKADPGKKYFVRGMGGRGGPTAEERDPRRRTRR